MVDSKKIPLYGLNIVPLGEVLSKVEDEDTLIDVAGLLVNVSAEREWQRNGRKGRMLIVDIMDESGTVECALFGSYVEQLHHFLSLGNLKEIVVVLQFVKMKMFQGKPVLQNVLQASRLMYNCEIPEVVELKKRLSRVGLLAQYPLVKVSSVARVSLEDEFLNNYPLEKISEILALSVVDGFFAVVADIVGVLSGGGWYYNSCKCRRAVVQDSGLYYCGFCDIHMVNVTPRFKLEAEVADDEASAVFVLFDREVEALIRKNCLDLLNSASGLAAVKSGNHPHEFDNMIGTRAVFKVQLKPDVDGNNSGTFKVKKICLDGKLVDKFVSEGGFVTPEKAKLGSGIASCEDAGGSNLDGGSHVVAGTIEESCVSLADDGVDLVHGRSGCKKNLSGQFEEVAEAKVVGSKRQKFVVME